jgi:hypothetical protein
MIGKSLACTALGPTLLVAVASAQRADGHAPPQARWDASDLQRF